MTHAMIDYMNANFTYQDGFRDGAAYDEDKSYPSPTSSTPRWIWLIWPDGTRIRLRYDERD